MAAIDRYHDRMEKEKYVLVAPSEIVGRMATDEERVWKKDELGAVYKE